MPIIVNVLNKGKEKGKKTKQDKTIPKQQFYSMKLN